MTRLKRAIRLETVSLSLVIIAVAISAWPIAYGYWPTSNLLARCLILATFPVIINSCLKVIVSRCRRPKNR